MGLSPRCICKGEKEAYGKTRQGGFEDEVIPTAGRAFLEGKKSGGSKWITFTVSGLAF